MELAGFEPATLKGLTPMLWSVVVGCLLAPTCTFLLKDRIYHLPKAPFDYMIETDSEGVEPPSLVLETNIMPLYEEPKRITNNS